MKIMSAFYYKNMLIVQYGSNDVYIRNFLLQHYKLWWDNDPFKYRNPNDMIVIFHSLNCKGIMSYNDPRIHNLSSVSPSDCFYPNGTMVGYMKILSNMGKLKITDCTLRGISDIKYNLPIFREYLIKTKCNILYWTPQALMSVEARVLYYKLLSNQKEYSYTFDMDEKDMKFPLEHKLSCITNILLKNSYSIPNAKKRLNDTNRIIVRPILGEST